MPMLRRQGRKIQSKNYDSVRPSDANVSDVIAWRRVTLRGRPTYCVGVLPIGRDETAWFHVNISGHQGTRIDDAPCKSSTAPLDWSNGLTPTSPSLVRQRREGRGNDVT
jgi:hypothetical protein